LPVFGSFDLKINHLNLINRLKINWLFVMESRRGLTDFPKMVDVSVYHG